MKSLRPLRGPPPTPFKLNGLVRGRFRFPRPRVPRYYPARLLYPPGARLHESHSKKGGGDDIFIRVRLAPAEGISRDNPFLLWSDHLAETLCSLSASVYSPRKGITLAVIQWPLSLDFDLFVTFCLLGGFAYQLG